MRKPPPGLGGGFLSSSGVLVDPTVPADSAPLQVLGGDLGPSVAVGVEDLDPTVLFDDLVTVQVLVENLGLVGPHCEVRCVLHGLCSLFSCLPF